MVQYLVFKQGADVHIFWPHPFATYFALGCGALAASVRDGSVWLAGRTRWASARTRERLVALAPVLPLLFIGLPLALVVKDGLSTFRLARETGGRFAEANLESDLEKAAVFHWFLPRIPAAATVGFHPSVHHYWDKQWELRPRQTFANQPVGGSPAQGRFYVMDTRGASPEDLKAAVGRYHVHAVEWIWIMDRTEPPAPLDGYSFGETEPTFFQRWAYGSTEPLRQIPARPLGNLGVADAARPDGDAAAGTRVDRRRSADCLQCGADQRRRGRRGRGALGPDEAIQLAGDGSIPGGDGADRRHCPPRGSAELHALLRRW